MSLTPPFPGTQITRYEALAAFWPLRPLICIGSSMASYQRVLFPTDYSRNSENALAHAIRLTQFDHGELIFQLVVSDPVVRLTFRRAD